MNELRQLLTHGAHYPRMTVADVVDRDPPSKIDKAPAFNVPDLRVFRPRGVKVERSADTPRRCRLLTHLQLAVRETLQHRIGHNTLPQIQLVYLANNGKNGQRIRLSASSLPLCTL
jgi:hypothetical protein